MPKPLDGKFYGLLYRQRDNQLEPPDSWMVFVARDNALPATLDFYRAECKRLGASDVQLAAIDDLHDCVMTWRANHPDQCKVPDVENGELRLNRGCGCQPLEIDEAGVDALLDVLHCWKATNSFAALADTSSGVYVGKVVRSKIDCKDEQFSVVELCGPSVSVRSLNGGVCVMRKVDDLLPLAPEKPKVRKLTPREMVEHLGREFRSTRDGHRRTVQLVAQTYVRDGQHTYDFGEMAETCVWEDGSPVGAPIAEPCGIQQ